jgi:hypothetical protein
MILEDWESKILWWGLSAALACGAKWGGSGGESKTQRVDLLLWVCHLFLLGSINPVLKLISLLPQEISLGYPLLGSLCWWSVSWTHILGSRQVQKPSTTSPSLLLLSLDLLGSDQQGSWLPPFPVVLRILNKSTPCDALRLGAEGWQWHSREPQHPTQSAASSWSKPPFPVGSYFPRSLIGAPRQHSLGSPVPSGITEDGIHLVTSGDN